MKKGGPGIGTFGELAQGRTFRVENGSTWGAVYDRENLIETTYTTESGTYTTTGSVGLRDPGPTLYDWAGRPIPPVTPPPVEDADVELEVHVADAMPPMRDASAVETKNSINLGATFTAEVKKKAEGAQGRIILPPGSSLRSFVNWVFSKKTAERVFLPVIADLQHEWMEAKGESRPWKARWVIIRGHWHFLTALGLQGAVSIAKRIFDIWKAMSAS